MKAYNFFAITLLSVLAFVGCNRDESGPLSEKNELALLPTTKDLDVTRSSSTSFFANGDQVKLAVTDNGGNSNYVYSYNNGVFSGINSSNTYYFFMDDQVVHSISVSWPTNRPSTAITDQRLDANFKMSDYMTATLQNVLATKEYVPVEFVHENAKVVFVVTGQNANGLAIQSLVVDVNNTGYWAHIDPVTGHGEIIIPPGNVTINANEIAGRIAIGGVTGSVVFQVSRTYTLVANTSYVVTLSPRGDNVFASVSIGGWYQNENGIGVPLIQQNGYYLINSEAQLYAIAQLISNYKPDTGNVDWTSANYMLTGDIVRSLPLRAWTTLTNFTGVFNYNGYTISPAITFAPGQ